MTPTATYIPSELRTEVLNPTPSIPAVIYSSGLHSNEAKEEDKPPSGDENHGHGMKLGPIIAASALSVFAFLAIVALMVLFLVRKIQKKSAGERGRVHRRDIEECTALHEIQRNDGDREEHLRPDDGERLHEPNGAGVERLHEPNDGEEDLQHREGRSQANDAEECVAPQETQLPVQATPSDIQIGG